MANNNARYKKEEDRLRAQSAAFIQMLVNRGMLEDNSILNERMRQVQQDKKKKSFHNTQLLLKNYRAIAWVVECFPDTVAEELEKPFLETDALLEHMDVLESMGFRKLESRIAGLQKSRLLLDRMNEALTVLKKKPGDGEKLYDLIYLTYITPEKLSISEILYRLDISSRHYYRMKEQAITILSIRLWSAPTSEVDRWLDILTLMESTEQ